jgi:MYXO-CTERM domain-containing protein
MKRLTALTTWQRTGIQAGLLAGLGLAFFGAPQTEAEAQDACPSEGECTFKKPNFLIVMDYSSSMRDPFTGAPNRWQAAENAVTNLVTSDNGFFGDNLHIGLMRYAHLNSPAPFQTGQTLDVGWYDQSAANPAYFECNGQDILDALAGINQPPANTYGTWTKGALDFARDYIVQTRFTFPGDQNPGSERYYGVLLMTDGAWTGTSGLSNDRPANQNPALAVTDLVALGVNVFVVAFGSVTSADFVELETAGAELIDAANTTQLNARVLEIVTGIRDSVIVPQCTAGLPRVMIILDASSSMLNVGGQPGAQGTTGWDQARAALSAATGSIFDVEVGTVGQPVEDLVHLGLLTFGAQNPAEEKLLVNYAPCMKDNFAWALDPETSCEASGCDDPWGGPPITWTFKNPTSPDYPGFVNDTQSHMPLCNTSIGNQDCRGSGTYTHRGLNLALSNYNAYTAINPSPYPIDGNTTFINILITDGQYNSTNAEMETSMRANFDAGIPTYVIAFGDGLGGATAQQQLNNLACWGSGGTGQPCSGGTVPFFDGGTQAELEAALADIISGLDFDPCCAFNDCSVTPEPELPEPAPSTDGSSTTGSTSTTDSGTTDGSTTDGTTTDGTTTDSGTTTDATTTDASTTDATTTDASTTDATTTDASTTDATTTDASTTDATTTDASTTDASTTDASTTDASTSGSGSGTSNSGTGTSASGTSGSASGSSSTTNASGGTDSAGTDTDGTGTGAADDDGCGCSTDAGSPRDVMGGLLGLALLGFLRRRRD